MTCTKSTEKVIFNAGSLPRPERLFLWAIRSWSAHHADISAIWWGLDSAFSHEQIHPALASFDSMMTALFAGLKRWPDVRCVRCAYLGADERQLLNMLANLQHGNEVGARLALQQWVLRAAVTTVCEHAGACIQIALAAGLRFAPLPTNQPSQRTTAASINLIDPVFSTGMQWS